MWSGNLQIRGGPDHTTQSNGKLGEWDAPDAPTFSCLSQTWSEFSNFVGRSAYLFGRRDPLCGDVIGEWWDRLPGLPLEGGLPIIHEGKVIGGIGVSGVKSTEDAQIARAGIQALIGN